MPDPALPILPLTLRDARQLFTSLVPTLITHALSMGLRPTIGEVVRSRSQALANAASGAGIAASLHLDGLAIDLNLYTATGAYLDKTEDHAALGRFWKLLHPLCRWGGDFRRPDGNHYSITWQGRS